ncbi:MFS family permease [Micromonospora luteifusca]|uniref:MFS family permease n=1 Tax=Micromonospora luteifusca TaxID=709860 RepID=A0ABS2LWD1_9ACTN|nr:MFS family permease [Micromonospora luteifusca]
MTAVHPAAATTTSARLPQRWLILAVLCVAQLVVVLHNTVLIVAVPVLTTELGASTAEAQWMINAYALVLSGLLLGCALANPAIVEAVMSVIPAEKAGAGAGVDGTMTEVGSSLGIAVRGAVLNARFAALLPAALSGAGSFPAALAAAREGAEREAVTVAFASALETGQLVGAAAVLVGGLVAAGLLHRADRPIPAQ